jgi:hypothetical protein
LQTLGDADHVDIPVHAIGWSPDGKFLAAAGAGRGIQVWEVATGARVWVHPSQLLAFAHVTWSPDGRRLASCGGEEYAYIWDANGTMLARLQGIKALSSSSPGVQMGGVWPAAGAPGVERY